MFAKFRIQQLQSCFFHSRDRPLPLMSRCSEIRKKNISKLWNLVIMTKVGCGLPRGGDGILHGFEFLNIWMVRHKKGVRVRNGLLDRFELPSQPFSTLTEMLRNRWEIFCHIPLSHFRRKILVIIVPNFETGVNHCVPCDVILFYHSKRCGKLITCGPRASSWVWKMYSDFLCIFCWCLLDPPKTCSFAGSIKLCCMLTSLLWGSVDSFADLFYGFYYIFTGESTADKFDNLRSFKILNTPLMLTKVRSVNPSESKRTVRRP